MAKQARLALFDLDHTLLDGDGDDLWCRFLVRCGLAGASEQACNDRMMADYRAGRVAAETFSGFYTGLFAGGSPDYWAPWLARFLAEEIRPRLPAAARALVEAHRAEGCTLVLTTACNRAIARGTSAELGFEHLLATELEVSNGVYTGRVAGTLNMREGKVQRVRDWLAEQGAPPETMAEAWFYTDSINDLPLLSAVGRPVVVNPDALLLRHANACGWPVQTLLPRAAG